MIKTLFNNIHFIKISGSRDCTECNATHCEHLFDDNAFETCLKEVDSSSIIDDCKTNYCDNSTNHSTDVYYSKFIDKCKQVIPDIQIQTHQTLLVLSFMEHIVYSRKTPVLIDINGRDDRNINFDYNDVFTIAMCSLKWKNEMYFFGYSDYSGLPYSAAAYRNIVKINSCKLEKISELSFNFNYGRCLNHNDEKIFLCFHYTADRSKGFLKIYLRRT